MPATYMVVREPPWDVPKVVGERERFDSKIKFAEPR
jgi:hypothetical protein